MHLSTLLALGFGFKALAESSGYYDPAERANDHVSDDVVQDLCASGWPSGKMLCLSWKWKTTCKGGGETSESANYCRQEDKGHDDWLDTAVVGENPGYPLFNFARDTILDYPRPDPNNNFQGVGDQKATQACLGFDAGTLKCLSDVSFVTCPGGNGLAIEEFVPIGKRCAQGILGKQRDYIENAVATTTREYVQFSKGAVAASSTSSAEAASSS